MNNGHLRFISVVGMTISIITISGCGEESLLKDAAKYRDEERYAEATLLYRKAAEKGSPEAQVQLGLIYSLELDEVEKDDNEAVYWFNKGAEQGHVIGQNGLCWSYTDGTGVAQSYIQGMKWCKKAAEQGDSSSQFKLGSMYAQGQGVEVNLTEAVAWFSKSAEQGYGAAQHMLGYMYERGWGGLAQDYAAAEKWYRKSVDQGNLFDKDSLDRIAEERERAENALGVAGVKLGMSAPQVERLLGKFKLVESEKAFMGGMFNLTPQGVDKRYSAVTTDTPGILNITRENPLTGELNMGALKFQKDGFMFWELKFTRKELGPRLLEMTVSREFDTQPDWDLVQEKLVEKYGAPSHTDTAPESYGRKVKRRLLWGECQDAKYWWNVSQCEGAVMLVNFEKRTRDLAGTHSWRVEMELFDGELEKENQVAIQKAIQAKITKTARQVQDLKF